MHRLRFRHAFILIVCAFFLSRAYAAPAEKVCAIVADSSDQSVSALAALVQTKTGQIADTRWVERVDVDHVLAEQKIATALGPESARERIALGKLLKADVLVMLRPMEPKRDSGVATKRGIHLVVAETRGGLRLLSRVIAVDASHEAGAADVVVALATTGVEKARQNVREVCALPPFSSSDLTYEFGYLKAAYPNLIEQALLERPGVVVVELAEARAIADEISLGGGNIARPLPIYVLGEYRNDGTGDARKQSLRITLKRGEKQLEQLDGKELSASDAVAFVRRAATRLIQIIDRASDKDDVPAAPEAKVEAQQLADRAALHRRAADWQEAAALTEAALLLTPDDAELHRQAVITYTRITYAAPPNMGERTAENVNRRAASFFRGLDHLEIFLQTAGDLERYQVPGGSNFVWDFLHSPGGWTESGHDFEKPEPWRRALAQCSARDREARLRIAHMRARTNHRDDTQYVVGALWMLPEPEQYQMIREFLDSTKDLPGTRDRATRLAAHGYVPTVLDSDEGRKLLAWMKGSENKDLMAAEAILEREIDYAKARQTAQVAEETKRFNAPTSAPVGPAEIVFTPLTFRIEGEGNRAIESISGLIPAGDGIDFAWVGSSCYVMKQKGILRPIWKTAESNVWVQSVSFDGRYVWLTAQRWKKGPLVLVLDPVAEKAWEVTADDGLPLNASPNDERTQYFARAVGVSPGLACIAGSFGRTWLAMITFHPATGPLGKIFHEATEAPNREDKEQWLKNSVAFVPTFMATLFDPKANPDRLAEKRVLIGREEAPGGFQYRPLVINPATRSVDVLEDEGPWTDNIQFWTVHEGALYWAWPTRRSSYENARPNIYRIGFPDLKRTTMAEHVYDGEEAYRDMLVFYDGRVHLLARQWWCADALDKPFRALRGDVPMRFRLPPPGHTVSELSNKETERIEGLLHSNHYGLLAQVRRNGPPNSTDQVTFPGR